MTLYKHIPVMPKQVIFFLKPKKNGVYLDATLGQGGHTSLIADLLSEKGKIIAIDQDIQAIQKAKINLAQHKNKISYFHDNFNNLEKILDQAKIKKLDGALFDLGTSINQLKSFERGFSFNESPENLNSFLDMRMDSSQKTSAQDVLNQYTENELKDVFINLGQESYIYANKLARNIVLKRRTKTIKTINDLLEIIKISLPRKYFLRNKRNHYATNVFRAIRMEVNQELIVLKKTLPKVIDFLNKQGRLVVISFHSLEDRTVKQIFNEIDKNKIKILTKKPIMADYAEIKQNPCADSAKIRALEKI